MANEIERKFLINSHLINIPAGEKIQQGYIYNDVNSVIRVRISGTKGFLTIKGPLIGITRSEFEYEIPCVDAEQMIKEFCKITLIKQRSKIKINDHVWEIDVFEGENKGLVIAEIELSSEDEYFELPIWINKEVTDDFKYYNNNLINHPFSQWK